jgi:hypothetical protein
VAWLHRAAHASAAQGCHEGRAHVSAHREHLSTDMIPELTEIAGHVGARSKEYAKGAAYVQDLPELPLGRIVNNERSRTTTRSSRPTRRRRASS